MQTPVLHPHGIRSRLLWANSAVLIARKPPQTSTTTSAEDFALEKYRLDRAHELELNRATLNYEHESLKILAYLNGGGAGVYVGFLSSTLKQPGFVPNDSSILAVAAWAMGLLAAAAALWVACESQVKFAQAYHARRRAEEKRRFAGIDANRLATDPEQTAESHEMDATEKVKEGRGGVAVVKRFGLASLVFFCLGLASALKSISGNVA